MNNEFSKQNVEPLVAELSKRINEPSLYQVFVHNDDFTPMEFVVGLLEKLFFMPRRRAADVMMEAHVQGKAGCGFFTRDVAESKIAQVIDQARTNEFPLTCSMEAAVS
jgi:ATP-dependent Clp protease adaptor protein ClpS